MTLFRKPIPVEEAVKRGMEVQQITKEEMVTLEESAGRVLAKDMYAPHPVPWFLRSPYDGYAVNAEATKAAGENSPIWLEVLGTIGAGDVWEGTVEINQAVKIMTGAAVPKGATAIIMRELTLEEVREGKTYVRIKRRLKDGENVSQIGEDMKEGQLLVHKGTFINAGVAALLATFGYETVPVCKKPRVGIIATGNELLNLGEELQPGKIRNSNAYMLQAQVIRSGAEPVYFGKVGDTFESTVQVMEKAMKETDLVLTTGGVSVGDFDYIPKAYEALGAKLLFNKIAMRPGSVTSAATAGDKLLFGLSGNPSACYVGFELFARPVIRTMLNMDKPYLQKIQAMLKTDIVKANPFNRYVRSKLSFSEGRTYVEPSGRDKSNMVSSLAGANCLAVLPGGTRGWEAGSIVDVLLLDDQEGMAIWE
ncbi:gephyrin-like molybdotransferase Glp [Ectobacillus panaciterrae]|uniref:molybdopterin molybdotransferase MoeA n=1 Tax=Ectobacillus panaciterrae TaxID=363872 RepID=UPI000428FDEF|nr:gephyrin-like molybdotransferase Glp [Ectobacillus panaciterrae]